MSGAVAAESRDSAKEFAEHRQSDALSRAKRFRDRMSMITVAVLAAAVVLLSAGAPFLGFAGVVVGIVCLLWLWTAYNHVKEVRRRPYGDPQRSIPDDVASAREQQRLPTSSPDAN